MFVGLFYSLLSQMPATESGVLPDDEMQRRWKGPTVKRVEDQGNYGDNMTYYRRPSFLSCHYAFCHAANTEGGGARIPQAKSKSTRRPFSWLQLPEGERGQSSAGQVSVQDVGRFRTRAQVTSVRSCPGDDADPGGLQLSLITLRQKPSGAAPSPPSGSSGCGSRSGGRGGEAARAHRGLVTCFSRRFRTLTLAAVVRLSGGEMAAREGMLWRWALGSEPSHFSDGVGAQRRRGRWH